MLLNALHFINTTSDKQTKNKDEESEVSSEASDKANFQKGLDMGHNCSVEESDLDKPEYATLITDGKKEREKVEIPQYALRARKYRL